jgi:GTP-binding protein
VSRRKHGKGYADQLAAPQRAGRPIVAIVGRPNVGKSALFNRLTGARLAIVQDRPGVTRDRLYADASAYGRDYVLVDTGGFDPHSDDPLKQSIADQVQLALSEADAVICLLDATSAPLPADREAIRLLRETQLPVLYTANKVDNDLVSIHAKELYQLGIKRLHEVSALHGHGVGDLEQALAQALPSPEPRPEGDAQPEAPDNPADPRVWLPRVAIVGRPNAGKSSLINRLLGEQRQIVDARPGTTVDSVDSLYDRDGQPLVLIDTAGIRRKRSVEHGLEGLAVMQALRALERCHTAILVIDAQDEGASQQDARIASLALERGRALCVALNKVDVLAGKEREAAVAKARSEFSFMPWTPLRPISARTGQGVSALMNTVREVTANHHRRVTTGEVNRFFEEVLARHPPPTSAGRAVRLYFATQARVAPPTFMVSTNFPDRVHTSYQRYVVNQLRERFGFEGTPIRVHYRPHKSE